MFSWSYGKYSFSAAGIYFAKNKLFSPIVNSGGMNVMYMVAGQFSIVGCCSRNNG